MPDNVFRKIAIVTDQEHRQARVHGDSPFFEFHILREVRERYKFDEGLFASNGNVILANFHAARVLAQKINDRRTPGEKIKAGHINAMGLIDEICHMLLRTYEEQENPGVFARAVKQMNSITGKEKFAAVLNAFTTLYPPLDVHRRKLTVDAYLTAGTSGKPHVESTAEEIILLYFANINPAFAPFKELFDDKNLNTASAYKALIGNLERFFRNEKPFGPDKQHIFDLLMAPILASPNSLEGQLEFIRKRWGVMLAKRFHERILGSDDFIKEDSKEIVHRLGPPQLIVPQYPSQEQSSFDQYEAERYSHDVEWMPRVVLLAKNSYVWLDQLSKKYGRSITQLDQIPDEELDQIARWNFTGLWLIGIWERSPASQKIKQMTGNPEAVSSAYSLYEYEIARDLGGEKAFYHLSHRAWQRGIRLAGDMVPNHMGLYSAWVVEHPDYFIQSSYSPFPNYRFTGPNLSDHPTVHLRIEDGYWNRSDAAVVFQRVDTSSGDVRYIYHGNDGTHMPWNDTAQLDFLKAEVREAVVQTIFHVARKFPIIRFDAAMTLTKKHFQRLWYPQPGTGGDIPSRADYALAKQEFDRLFPAEFWREVVDRIARELPNTLLLAEAFWLLEGYFVRTLGMHRVYNSAFMHMLMKEENAKYRELIKNTLAYDPEILKRYVNFMSNPDERTAVDQFGKDGKYFGVAVLMVTLPGLPMFAHGQIEGYTEKYGMEYKRAYYNESPDESLVARHEREIFPILSKRYLFSQVTNFEFFDVIDETGNVNENIFAYSNRNDSNRVLVFYNNKYAEGRGWIRNSCPKAIAMSGTEKKIRSASLCDALRLNNAPGVYYIFQETGSGLEFVRAGKEICERGFYVGLKAFQYNVFMNFKEVQDTTGDYGRLASYLQGRPVPDIQQSLLELRLQPLHDTLRQVVKEIANYLARDKENLLPVIVENFRTFLKNVEFSIQSSPDDTGNVDTFSHRLIASRKLYMHISSKSVQNKNTILINEKDVIMLACWLVCGGFGNINMLREKHWLEAVQLPTAFASMFTGDGTAEERVALLRILIEHPQDEPADSLQFPLKVIRPLLENRRVQEYMFTNFFSGIAYYNRERFEELLRWKIILNMVLTIAAKGFEIKDTRELVTEMSTLQSGIQAIAEATEFRLEGFKEKLSFDHQPGLKS